jgi:uncharacterized membrane protein
MVLRFTVLFISVASLAVLAAACSSAPSAASDGGNASACVAATSCPDAGAPSYASVVQPIIAGECLACHDTGGIAGYDESTYAKVAAQASAMLDQVNGCMMPPAGGPQMSDAQRVALTAWLRCGAPDN